MATTIAIFITIATIVFSMPISALDVDGFAMGGEDQCVHREMMILLCTLDVALTIVFMSFKVWV
jgi:hypothetical protein